MINKFDYTAMSTFLTCRRKFNYRINRGLVRKVEATPLTFGSAIHEALNVWFAKKDVNLSVEKFHEVYKENLEVDDKRTNKMGEWILRNYDMRYKDAPWELVANEQVFSIPLPNGKVFTGRIDKIIKWDGVLWNVDHKTTSQLGPTFIQMAEPNMQFNNYVWAARQMGFNVVGFVLDAILVAKGLLPGASKNNNLTPLQRYDVTRSDEVIQESVNTMISIQKDISLCEELNEWYPNFDACTDYGGCAFRGVCKEDASIRDKLIEQDFKVDFWDPLKIKE